MLRVFSENDKEEHIPELKARISSCLKLIGRFSPFKSFTELIHKYLNQEISRNESNLFNGLTGYKSLLEGFLQALPAGEGFLDKQEAVEGVVDKLGDSLWLDNLSRYTLPVFSEVFEVVLRRVKEQGKEDEVRIIINF